MKYSMSTRRRFRQERTKSIWGPSKEAASPPPAIWVLALLMLILLVTR